MLKVISGFIDEAAFHKVIVFLDWFYNLEPSKSGYTAAKLYWKVIGSLNAIQGYASIYWLDVLDTTMLLNRQLHFKSLSIWNSGS